jgi:hypothetical protein
LLQVENHLKYDHGNEPGEPGTHHLKSTFPDQTATEPSHKSGWPEHLRAAKARLLDILDQAVSEAISTVTAQNAAAWFNHSGYGVQQL